MLARFGSDGTSDKEASSSSTRFRCAEAAKRGQANLQLSEGSHGGGRSAPSPCGCPRRPTVESDALAEIALNGDGNVEGMRGIPVDLRPQLGAVRREMLAVARRHPVIARTAEDQERARQAAAGASPWRRTRGTARRLRRTPTGWPQWRRASLRCRHCSGRSGICFLGRHRMDTAVSPASLMNSCPGLAQ